MCHLSNITFIIKQQVKLHWLQKVLCDTWHIFIQKIWEFDRLKKNYLLNGRITLYFYTELFSTSSIHYFNFGPVVQEEMLFEERILQMSDPRGRSQ